MKKLGIIIAVLLVVVLVLSVGKNIIAKTAVEKGVELVTGLKLRISKLNIGVINTLVGIKDLTLYNPKGYQDRVMVNIPEIYVDYDLGAIIGGNIHLNDVKINLNEFVVIKNEKGELNLDSLKVVQAQKEGKAPSEKEKAKAPDIKIDKLQLIIGKVIYKDYSKGGQPSVREFNINLDETYTDITDPHSLVSLIVVKALMNTTIASLTNFDLSGLEGTVGETLTKAKEVAAQTATKAKEAVATTSKKVSETASKITDKIKLPFQGKE